MHITSPVQGGPGLQNRPKATYCDCREPRLRDVAYVIDTEPDLWNHLSGLKGLIDLEFVGFDSAQEFLRYKREDESACLILNLHSHHHEGFRLQCQLAAEASPPVVFISSLGDVSAAVRALKSGAVDLLTPPIVPIELAEAVLTAFDLDRRQRRQRAARQKLEQRHDLLTPREREVLPLVAKGLLNKQAAAVLGISETTLQIHRSQVMRKMQADSVAELVRIAATLKIPVWSDCDSDGVEFSNLEPLTTLRNRQS